MRINCTISQSAGTATCENASLANILASFMMRLGFTHPISINQEPADIKGKGIKEHLFLWKQERKSPPAPPQRMVSV